MAVNLTGVSIIVNDNTIGVLPNTVKYTEGFGEDNIRVVSVGGGATEQVYSEDLESNFSMISFDMLPTIPNVKLARSWKTNTNQNVVILQVENADGDLTRTFKSAALTANYEVNIGNDAAITIEFRSNSAI